MPRFDATFVGSLCVVAIMAFAVDQLLVCEDDVREDAVKPPTQQPSSRVYNSTLPVVFVVGIPRSGSSLLRAMLDAHDEILCNDEVYVLDQLFGMHARWQHAGKETAFLVEGGVNRRVLTAGVSAFALQVMTRGGAQPRYLCGKVAFALSWSEYIVEMFPNVRFLMAVRDGRAVAHSIITSQIRIPGFMARNVTQSLRQWNRIVRLLDMDCRYLGPLRCHYVHYERLVLDTEATMRSVLEFLGVQWNSSVLHPDRFAVHFSSLKRYRYQIPPHFSS